MRRSTIVFGSSLVIAMSAAGCQEQVSEPTSAVPVTRQASSVAADVTLRGSQQLPAGLRISDILQSNLNSAITPGDYVCTGSTAISDWWLAAAYDIIDNEPAVFNVVYGLAGDGVVTYDALLYQSSSTPQTYGYNGEYTQIMNKVEKDAKRFWDINSADIQVVGMHGTMLTDTARVALVYRTVYGIPAGTAAVYAAMMRNAVLTSQTVNGGNHPLFSFNAYAASFGGPYPDKIAMGDGMLAGYEYLGFGDVAAQAIFAHEFAHHIQYENGYFGEIVGGEPEQTRYTELMADAYAAYFLTHARGASMNQKRVEQFLEAFYQIGDCSFSADGHHGTPNQRRKASQLGFDIASQAQKQGHILSSEAFHALFVAAYPSIIAPDAN